MSRPFLSLCVVCMYSWVLRLPPTTQRHAAGDAGVRLMGQSKLPIGVTFFVCACLRPVSAGNPYDPVQGLRGKRLNVFLYGCNQIIQQDISFMCFIFAF